MEIEIIDMHTGEIWVEQTIADAKHHIAERRNAVVKHIDIEDTGVSYLVDFGSDIPF